MCLLNSKVATREEEEEANDCEEINSNNTSDNFLFVFELNFVAVKYISVMCINSFQYVIR